MSILSRMASAAARYWYLLFLGILGSGAAAYFGSNYFVKKTWESSSTILYTSLPIGESERGLFIPPDLKTITALVNSPSTLETIRDEFHLDLPVKALDKNLTVLVPNGTKMINLTLKWEDGPTCVAMLNRLTDLFIGRVDDIRRKKLGAHIEDFENSLIAVQKRYDEAAAKLQEIYRREKLVDYKSESVATLVEISQLESTLAEHRREELDTLAKMERMETHLNEVKDQEVREVEVEKQFEATTETVADNRRRQDRIRELIGDERRMQEYRAELEAKSKEIIRTRKLAVRGLISQAELEAAEAEIIGLRSKLEDNEKIRKLQEELDRIDKVVVPSGAKKKSGSPIIQQILFRKLEMELELAGTRQEIKQIQEHVKRRSDNLVRLDGLKGEIERLTKKLESSDAERVQLERQLGALRNLQSLKLGELSVVARAEPSPFPASSNKKLLIIGIGGFGCLCSFGFVIMLDMLAHSRTVRSKARRLGLATLAELPSLRPLRHQQLRGLALRLRQYLPEAGSVVLFSSLTESTEIEGILEDLADCLALRDERILILDTRIGERALCPPPETRNSSQKSSWRSSRKKESVASAQNVLALPTNPPGQDSQKGLAEYLSYACNDLDEICLPAAGFGVDRVVAGEAAVEFDMLATHRMNQLISELRQRYTMLLVIAPPLEHAVELQILSALSQGIIAVVDSPRRVSSNTLRSLSELQGLGAPLLGQIVCDATVAS